MKLLAVNQSTTALFRGVVEALAGVGVHVRLLAGHLEHDGQAPLPFERLRACRLAKSPAWRRIWTWGAFTAQAFWTMARQRDRFALLTTNPPLVPWVAPLAQRLFGVRYGVLVYDVYPDVMVQMGMIRAGGWIHGLLLWLARNSYRRADTVIALSDRMRNVIQSQMAPGEAVDVAVIPNWADTEFIRPLPKAANPFARQHGLLENLVVMYSGALGLTHDCETLIDAAERVKDLPQVRFVLVGGGTREKEVRAHAAAKDLPNLTILPWQPLKQTPFSLTAADVHVVSLDRALSGISVPSKTYTALAAGAALLYSGDAHSEVADLISQNDCGIRVEPHDAEALASAVRLLCADRDRLERMRRNARRAAVEWYSARTVLPRYVERLVPLLSTRAARPAHAIPVGVREHPGFYRRHGKRAFDLVAALAALVVASPLMGALALLVRWRLGSPVLFRQTRPGLDGRPFALIKFRTMRNASDNEGRPLPDSERLTAFGRFLRKTSLDELPELINVLRGHMSLVGPRPLLTDYLPHYTPREALRHTVRPGITGLAQVSGRNALGWDERLEWDARYVERLSFRLDLWIMWRTVGRVLTAADVATDTSLAEGNLAALRTSARQHEGKHCL